MNSNNEFAAFWNVSSQLCDFLQNPQHLSEKAYRRKLVLLILEVYKAGLALPETETPGNDELDDDHLDDQVGKLELAYEKEIGDVDYYLESYEPFNFEENTLVNASLIEGLKEIFRQLKIQLLKLETNEEKWIADAEWSIQFYLNLSLLDEMMDLSRAVHYSLQIDN
jgi:hypothetical protein